MTKGDDHLEGDAVAGPEAVRENEDIFEEVIVENGSSIYTRGTEGSYFNRSLKEPTLAVIESLEQTTTVIQQLETRKYVQVH